MFHVHPPILADPVQGFEFVISEITRPIKQYSGADVAMEEQISGVGTRESMSLQTPRGSQGRPWTPSGMLRLESEIHIGSSSCSTRLLMRAVFISSYIKHIWLTEQNRAWLRPSLLLSLGLRTPRLYYFRCTKGRQELGSPL